MNQPRRKSAFHIEPFRHKVEMDPRYAEKTWGILEDAIHQIYNHNASGLSFEELYRNAYNMVLHKYGDRLYAGLVSTMTNHLKGVAAAIEAAHGPLFLNELDARWHDYGKSLQMIRDILMYMDRTYVTNHNKTPVHDLGLALWHDHIVRAPAIRPRLLSTILSLVHQERSGEVINRALMRSISSMFADLGPAVYSEDLERPFLEASAAFYCGEAQRHLATCDCADYLNVAERRLEEEGERVAQYLDARTEGKVTGVVEREMVGNHLRLLVDMENSGLVPMLVNDKYEEEGERVAQYLDARTEGKVTGVVEREMVGNHLRLLVDMENSGLVPMLVNDKYEEEGERAAQYLGERTEGKVTGVVEREMVGNHLRLLVDMENSGLVPMLVNDKYEYLDARTEGKVTGVVEREMVGNHLRLLVDMENSGLVPMLVNDKYEDIARMYRLLKRVPQGLQTMREVMSGHLRETGRQLVTDPDRCKDPVEFVQRLLEEKDKYDRIIAASFASDKTFQTALSTAFEFFLNLNARAAEYISLFIDDKLRKGLKGASEEEAEAVLDKVMTLFRFLQEKDVFEKYYKQHLAKRLLSGKTVSDDAERSFIVKLKTECGYQFTSKLEGMFLDMKTSQDTMHAFHCALQAEAAAAAAAAGGGGVGEERGGGEGEVEDPASGVAAAAGAAGAAAGGGAAAAGGALREEGGDEGGEEEGEGSARGGAAAAAAAALRAEPDLALAGPSGTAAGSGAGSSSSSAAGGAAAVGLFQGPTLSVQVLTTGSWPTQAGARCNLPGEILPICEKFTRHYLTTHTGRRLTWQMNMGHADVKATFESRKYELSVSTYQMCILMLFNTHESLTYRDIEAATDIPSADLRRNLQSLSLVRGKNVLRKEPVGKEVGDDDMFHFNHKFTSKFFKVKTGTISAQKETEPEKAETRQKVEEDRKPQIEAAIVRIMKSRRMLDHNNLVSEVTKQLQARFLPNPAVIKKRIESLIEREFLERDRNDRKLYRYLA
ncbi:unnamed protein product [Closterium sp. Yama58-4]|nr:unnamed protein product [Closterium sp. Yama58-4]